MALIDLNELLNELVISLKSFFSREVDTFITSKGLHFYHILDRATNTSLNRETVCNIYYIPILMMVRCLLFIISLDLSAMITPNYALMDILEGFKI